MVNHKKSALLSFGAVIGLTIFTQIAKGFLTSTKEGVLLAGVIGSFIYVFLLTSVSNFKNSNHNFIVYSGIFDVFISIIISAIIMSFVQGVAVTVTILFSLFWTIALSNISDKKYTSIVGGASVKNVTFCSRVINCHNYASCLTCPFPKNCTYGDKYSVICLPLRNCKIRTPVRKMMNCKYCYQTKLKIEHDCAEVRNCTSTSVRLVRSICRVKQTTFCLGRRVFYQNIRCHWTNGYSWKKTFFISIIGGGFGAERFYLGYWKSGLAKLVTFGGLGIWTTIDLILVALGYLGPADGSLYI
uniref:Elongator complex protein 1 n=1 Tax=Strongyloides stercoralis TaxID=6248 RepID=A0AAF5HXV2_STRER